MKVAVTGAMGYIGSHIVKTLKYNDIQVIGIDHRHVEQNEVEGVEYIYGDYGDEEIWHAIATDPVNVDRFGTLSGIVHCAGDTSVSDSVANPSQYYNNNVAKTIAMLDFFKDLDSKPFIIFSSSASVYGSTVQYLSDPNIKEHVMAAPESTYARTKAMVEQIIQDYSAAYGFNYTIFRYFNAAGLNVWDNDLCIEDNDPHIIPQLFKAYKNNEPFRLYGTDYNTIDGSCVRDYVHVCDVASAHAVMCFEQTQYPENGIYNLGSGIGYSNWEVIETFQEVVGDIEVIEEPRRGGDTDRLVADPSAFIFKFDQRTQWSDLRNIIESMKRNYE